MQQDLISVMSLVICLYQHLYFCSANRKLEGSRGKLPRDGEGGESGEFLTTVYVFVDTDPSVRISAWAVNTVLSGKLVAAALVLSISVCLLNSRGHHADGGD